MGKHHWFKTERYDVSAKPPAVLSMEPFAEVRSRLLRSRTDPDIDRPAVSTACQEQLGLRVASGRAPVDMLVIGPAERPAED